MYSIWNYITALALLAPFALQSQGGYPGYEEHFTPGQAKGQSARVVYLPGQKYYLAKGRVKTLSPESIVRQLGPEYAIIAIQDTSGFPFTAYELLLPANDEWKLSPQFSPDGERDAAKKEGILVRAADMAGLRYRLRSMGLAERVKEEYPEAGAMLLWLSVEEVRRYILPLDEVVFAGRRNSVPREERAVRGFDLSVNKVNALHALYPELRGEGQVVSVKEDRFDTTDIDLRGRIVPSGIASPVQSSHATTMASMIAGAGNTFYTGKGVAWGAGLSSSSFLNVLPDPAAYFEASGIRVQNHSYGLDIENFYGLEAEAYDRQVYQNPTLAHVFSAGNMGDSTSRAGPYQGVAGFANLSGNFKMAKNVLTVGVVDSVLHIPVRSSRGPAYDGRVKPELVAFGEDGSSGAAAVTSGLVIILQEAYRKQYGGMWPAAALLRAVLLNSADDIGPPGPDYASGFGNVNALNAMETISEGRFFTGSLMPGMSESFTIEAPANAFNLKVTLAWTDPPALVNSAPALVNDLRLRLIHPAGGEQWLPWVLSAFPHPDSLSLPASRREDHFNNQEQITVEQPAEGLYEVEVSATGFSEGPQEFFVSYQWDTIGHFEWAFPTRTDNARAGERMPVRWESTMGGGTAVLEYRLLGENTWSLIGENVALETPWFFWDVPDTFALAQLRMSRSARAVISDTFTISSPLRAELGFECADSLLLHWNGRAVVDSFLVYALDGPYLEPLDVVQDTFIVIDKKQGSSRFYAVSPYTAGFSVLGERSFALNLDFQSAGCYIQNFLANLIGEEVELKLFLGSSYQVDSLVFEKERSGEFAAVAAAGSNGGLEAAYVDRELEEGLNTYRAAVVLADGARLYTEQLSVLFTRAAYLIHPNPVPAGQDVNVLSKNPGEAYLLLYDGLGRLLTKYALAGSSEAIPTQTLARGVYFYQVITKGEKRAEDKLLIR